MSDPHEQLCRKISSRHQIIGWWALLVFLSLGIGLETLHGLKLGLYLDPPNRLRRLMWTLAHAHGTLLALINIGFACSIPMIGRWRERHLRLASFLMIDATVLLPLGFFLGGIGYNEVDPGQGVLLVPVGALFLWVAVMLVAFGMTKSVGTHSRDK